MFETELEALQVLCGLARPGDVVGLMCHAERPEVLEWIERSGGTADGPDDLREKVRRARG